jgi:16S rRNA (uracil1498-N3)-methyltransferase
MRDRRFLVDPADWREDRAFIRDGELKHLSRVLRLGAGDAVTVFDGRGRGCHARLESVTPEIGASAIEPVVAARCVVRPGSRWGRADRLRKIAASAAKQSGRLVVPAILDPVPLADAMGRERPAGTLRILLEAGGADIADLAAGASRAGAALLVGPEGGWTPGEMEAARAAGWIAAGLGATTLRSDTACVVGAGHLARLMARLPREG